MKKYFCEKNLPENICHRKTAHIDFGCAPQFFLKLEMFAGNKNSWDRFHFTMKL